MLTLPVHRIIPFSNVEGIGNRTSIFVQGCNANCLYCHNSETIPMHSEETSRYSVDDLVELIKSSMPFIRGITVSGGEATLYPEFLSQLFKRVHELGLTCYIDTNGFFNISQLSELIDVTDKFLFDVKGLGTSLSKLCFSDTALTPSKKRHQLSDTYAINQGHIANLRYLLTLNKVEEVRLVYIKGYYDEKEVVEMIADCIKPYSCVTFKIIRVHTQGLQKERLLELKGHIPSVIKLEKLGDYAKSLNIAKVITIM